SGFLIGGILLRWLTNPDSNGSLFGFWRRRWLRTLPNYFLFLTINWFVAVHVYKTIPAVLRYALLLQNLSSPPGSFFGESWSLSVEEWFYLLTPILFVVARGIRPDGFRSSSLLIICGVIGVVIVARGNYIATTSSASISDVQGIVVYRLDACMFGVLAAWIKHFHETIWRKHPAV